jgi:hypothetical protein
MSCSILNYTNLNNGLDHEDNQGQGITFWTY